MHTPRHVSGHHGLRSLNPSFQVIPTLRVPLQCPICSSLEFTHAGQDNLVYLIRGRLKTLMRVVEDCYSIVEKWVPELSSEREHVVHDLENLQLSRLHSFQWSGTRKLLTYSNQQNGLIEDYLDVRVISDGVAQVDFEHVSSTSQYC
jgi:hypothetical protein